jgi:hypothetical protein
MLVRGLLHTAFIMLMHDPSVPSFFGAYHERMLNFFFGFSGMCGDDDIIFVFDSLYMLHCIY